MKISFDKFKRLILENANPILHYAYHCTNTNPEIIHAEGFKVGKKGFTVINQFEDLYRKYLPQVPVFITDDGEDLWDTHTKYVYKLNISGLKLYPDFGHLPDFGAYYGENEEMFYWEDINDIDNKKLKQYVKENENVYDEPIIYAADFTGEDSLRLIGSACVSGEGLENRIVEIIGR